MHPSILILGFGWVAQHYLNQSQLQFSDIVTTSRQSPAPAKSTHHKFMDIYHPTFPILPKSDVALISVPFSRSLPQPWQYTEGIRQLVRQLPPPGRLIFTSSTSVYPLTNGWVTEDTPIATTQRAQALNEAENHVLNAGVPATILRLGGICGGSRNSVSKCKTSSIPHGQTPVNLIHIADIVSTIDACIIKNSSACDVVNVVADDHPTKAAYYTHICNTFNLPLPVFTPHTSHFKRVSNTKLKTKYLPKLHYPSPLQFKFNND